MSQGHFYEVFGLLMFSFMCVDVKVAWEKKRKFEVRNTKKRCVLCLLESLQVRSEPKLGTQNDLQLINGTCFGFAF